jgi:subtilisin family serine protease
MHRPESSRSKRPSKARRSTRPLRLESLEARRLLAADLASLKTLMPTWFAAAKPPAPALTAVVRSLSTSSVKAAASPAMATTEWIVQLSDPSLKTIRTVGDAATVLANPTLGVTVVRGLGLPGQLLVSATGAPASVRAHLRSLPAVKAFERDGVQFSMATMPNDPRFTAGDLWGLHNTGQAGGTADADIDAPEAWDVSTGSSAVVVAVIDSGVQIDHPDLLDNIWTNPGETPGDGIDNDSNGFVDDVNGWDFFNDDASVYDGPDDDHGTHCAGTIAGRGNNGTGVVGVSWNTKIMPLKFLGPPGQSRTSDAVAAVNYATMMKSRGVNIPITSNSWGGGGASAALKSAIEAGGSAGILFVAAAGNSASNNDSTPAYPASYDSAAIVAVAATDRRDAMASFSNFGSTSVDLGAPGASIVSTVPDSTYASYSGTSMAAPHVSGVAALAVSVDPTLTVSQLKEALLASVDRIPSLAGRTVTGGRLNAAKTLEFVNPSLKLLSVTPAGSVGAPVSSIVATFNEQVLPAAVVASNFALKGDGLDGTFGTADDVTVTFADTNVVQAATGVITITLPSPLTTTERYVFTLKGTGDNPLRNLKGRALGQWGTATTGRDVEKAFMVRNFVEPNDTLATAIVVPPTSGRVALEGTIGDGPAAIRDVDLYRVSLAAGQGLTVDIDAKKLPGGSTLDSFVRIFSATGRQLASNDDDGVTTDSFARFIAPAAGDYLVAVSGFGNGSYSPTAIGSGAVGSVGDYQLALTLGPAAAALSADIVDVTPDPRTTAVSSIVVSFNRAVSGFDLADLALTRDGAPLPLAGASLTPALDRRTWTLAGAALERATNASGGYRLALVAAGSGIIDASGTSLATGAVDEWQTTLPPPPPTPPSTDIGDTLATAAVLSPAPTTVVEGTVGDGLNRSRDVDLYRIVVTAGQTLTLDIDARSLTPRSTLDSVVRLFDASGRLVASNDNDTRNGSESRDSFLTWTATAGGTFFVGVSGFGNAAYDPRVVTGERRAGSTGAYRLTVSLAGPQTSTAALAFAALASPGRESP